MKIINFVPPHFDGHSDPLAWIDESRFLKGIWEEMARMGHDVSFVEFIDFTGNVHHNGISYCFKDLHKPALRVPLLSLWAIAKAKPDIVVVHGLLFPHIILMLRFLLPGKTKIVVQHHAEKPFGNYFKRWLQKKADNFIDAYFFTSRELANSWPDRKVIPQEHKIREVMEVSSVFKQIDKSLAREKTNVTGESAYIWVGHLNANKNPLLIVRAFSELLEHEKDIHLYMIFQSKELLPEIERFLALRPGLEQHIHLIGKLPHNELLFWLNSADFIVSTSFYEAAGVSVLEAMSCGCIPVLSDIPAFRSVTDNNCGILFESGSEHALFEALKKSLLMDKGSERNKTIDQFNQKLSFAAIAKKIDQILGAL